MGCLWAARIWQQAQLGGEQNGKVPPVTLLLRDESALTRWQRVGGVMVQTNGTEALVPVDATTIANYHGPIDKLLLCTKAQDALITLGSVAHLLHANSQVFLIQNGIKSQRAIAEEFPALMQLCLSTSHGAYLLADFNVVHAGHGQSHLGLLKNADLLSSQGKLQILNSLPTASMNITWDPDITGRLWTKFAINCAINALTVIYNCRNGELLTRPGAASELRELCIEIENIMLTIPACPQPLTLYQKVKTVIEATARNYSSTLQDVRNGRRTEIDYFNGYMGELAQLADMDCPLNDDILRRFNAIAKHISD